MSEQDDAEHVEAFRELRAKAARADALEAEVRELRTDAAFRDSDLSLNAHQREAIVATSDGPLDADGVREAAERLSFVVAPQVPVAEQEVHARIAEATAGAVAAEAHVISLSDRIKATRTPEELERVMSDAGLFGYE